MSETPELLAALCKAQAAFGPAIKDAANPFFKSKYADLGAVWDACKASLSENSLFVSQQPFLIEGRDVLRTRVYHASGGFIESIMPVVVTKNNDPQAFGSAMTYTRRYSLAGILGIVTDDDDAEGAMSRNQSQPVQKASKQAPREMAQPDAEAKALDAEPVTTEQKDTIIKMLTHPMITTDYKKKVLEGLGKVKKTEADAWIKTMKTKQDKWEQSNKEELHDLITTHSETIGDEIVKHYFAILEKGDVKDVAETLDKVKFSIDLNTAA